MQRSGTPLYKHACTLNIAGRAHQSRQTGDCAQHGERYNKDEGRTLYFVWSRLQVRTSGAMYATVPTVDFGADAYMFCTSTPSVRTHATVNVRAKTR